MVVILAVVAAQLRSRCMVFNLGWTLRDQNEEADAVTNGDYSLFNPTNRVNVVIEEVSWLILPRMMQFATDIYEDVRRHRASRARSPAQAAPLKKARGSLRQRDPW